MEFAQLRGHCFVVQLNSSIFSNILPCFCSRKWAKKCRTNLNPFVRRSASTCDILLSLHMFVCHLIQTLSQSLSSPPSSRKARYWCALGLSLPRVQVISSVCRLNPFSFVLLFFSAVPSTSSFVLEAQQWLHWDVSRHDYLHQMQTCSWRRYGRQWSVIGDYIFDIFFGCSSPSVSSSNLDFNTAYDAVGYGRNLCMRRFIVVRSGRTRTFTLQAIPLEMEQHPRSLGHLFCNSSPNLTPSIPRPLRLGDMVDGCVWFACWMSLDWAINQRPETRHFTCHS